MSPESALSELPYQALSDLPFPFIKLFDRDHSFFVEQLCETVEKRSGLQYLPGVVIDEDVGVKETRDISFLLELNLCRT